MNASARTTSWLRSYHFVIAIAGCVILLISNGMALSGLTPFRTELVKTFGFSMGQLTFGDLVTFSVVGVLAPLLGAVMDRFGVKRLMMLGGAVLSGAYVVYGRVDSLSDVYTAHVLLGIGIALSGLVPTARLIGRWFNAKRGTAMGIALAGSSLASYVFAPLAIKFIPQYGITGSFDRLAIAGLVLILFVAFVVVDEPESKGLTCLGEAPQTGGELPGLEFGAALRTLSFWCLCFAAAGTFFSMLGTLYNLYPHMLKLGFDPGKAVLGLQVMLTAALVGKFGFGWLSDRLPPKTVFLGNLVVMAIGALLMAQAGQGGIWLALCVFGLGWGGLYTMLQLLVVQCFGMRAIGKLMGVIAFFDAVGGGAGSFAMGVIVTRYGSYTNGYYLMFVLIVLGLLASTQVRTHFVTAR